MWILQKLALHVIYGHSLLFAGPVPWVGFSPEGVLYCVLLSSGSVPQLSSISPRYPAGMQTSAVTSSVSVAHCNSFAPAAPHSRPPCPALVLAAAAAGTGKTSSARVLSSRVALPLVYVPLEGLTSKWYGESEQNMAKVGGVGAVAAGRPVCFTACNSTCSNCCWNER